MDHTDQSSNQVNGEVEASRAHASAKAMCQNSTHQVAVQFGSSDDLDAAIDWLWTEPELRELPRVHVGDNTMIVPAAAIEQFRQQGYRFTEQPVVSSGDLASDEINRIRHNGAATK